MSTISGEKAVKINPYARQTAPGKRGRRLVRTCPNEHILPSRGFLDMVEPCPECGAIGRKWTLTCPPLWREVWEWIRWYFRHPLTARPIEIESDPLVRKSEPHKAFIRGLK